MTQENNHTFPFQSLAAAVCSYLSVCACVCLCILTTRLCLLVTQDAGCWHRQLRPVIGRLYEQGEGSRAQWSDLESISADNAKRGVTPHRQTDRQTEREKERERERIQTSNREYV